MKYAISRGGLANREQHQKSLRSAEDLQVEKRGGGIEEGNSSSKVEGTVSVEIPTDYYGLLFFAGKILLKDARATPFNSIAPGFCDEYPSAMNIQRTDLGKTALEKTPAEGDGVLALPSGIEPLSPP